MAGMAVFYVAGYLIEERRRWPLTLAMHSLAAESWPRQSETEPTCFFVRKLI